MTEHAATASPPAAGDGRLDDDTRGRLRRFNLVVGLVHALQAAALLALSNDLALPVLGSFIGQDPVTVTEPPAPELLFDVRIGWAVAAFVALAAADHLLVAGPLRERYEAMLAAGRNDVRWVEYGVSASLMLVLIAMFVGIWEVGALVALFAVNSAMIGFGALQERFTSPGRDTSLLPFWMGTAAGLVPWAVISIYLLRDASAVPGFVFGIYAVELLFFASFGVNQWLQYRRVGRWSSYVFGERAYVWLSLFAKSALAWLVFGNVLRT